MADKRIWEQKTGEPQAAFEAFCRYRDMHGIRRTNAVLGARYQQLVDWSRDWEWVPRVQAYDEHMQAIMLDERERILKQKASEVHADHLAMLQSTRQIVQRELDKLLKASKDADNEVEALPAGVIHKLLESAIKLDRLVRGESTEIVETKTADLSKLSTEELKALRDIKKKISGGEE